MDIETAYNVIEEVCYEPGTYYTFLSDQEAHDLYVEAVSVIRSLGGFQEKDGGWYFD